MIESATALAPLLWKAAVIELSGAKMKLTTAGVLLAVTVTN
jgi:hypothetical protein